MLASSTPKHQERCNQPTGLLRGHCYSISLLRENRVTTTNHQIRRTITTIKNVLQLRWREMMRSKATLRLRRISDPASTLGGENLPFPHILLEAIRVWIRLQNRNVGAKIITQGEICWHVGEYAIRFQVGSIIFKPALTFVSIKFSDYSREELLQDPLRP